MHAHKHGSRMHVFIQRSLASTYHARLCMSPALSPVLVQTGWIAAPHQRLPLATLLLISCSYQVLGRAYFSRFTDERTKAQRDSSLAQGHTAAADLRLTPRGLRPSLCSPCCHTNQKAPAERASGAGWAGWGEGVGIAAWDPGEGGTGAKAEVGTALRGLGSVTASASAPARV